MALLTIRDVSKQSDEGFILHDINFTIKQFQKTVIAGETGSGKSTLLKIIAGLAQPDSGEVLINNERVLGSEEQLVPGRKDVAYLSQHFDLPKFLRVEQVLEYANSLPAEEAFSIYEICRLDYLLKRKTDQLSGGEKQRIAIARLLITKPKILLLDEPFSNLDLTLKDILKIVIDDIGRKLRITCVLVSHDPDDTLPWADEIIVLKKGLIVQHGNPTDIYLRPMNEYIAGLFGRFNVISHSLIKKLDIRTDSKNLLIRPEQLKIKSVKSKKSFRGEVTGNYFYGSYYEAEITVNENRLLIKEKSPIVIGTKVYVSLNGKKRF
jgi:iron(III) transport system ATP-binding protein